MAGLSRVRLARSAGGLRRGDRRQAVDRGGRRASVTDSETPVGAAADRSGRRGATSWRLAEVDEQADAGLEPAGPKFWS